MREKRKKHIEGQTAEKGIGEFPFDVVFFYDGDRGKHAEGLPQDGKTAEGNKKGNKGEPQAKGVGGKAQEISAVCHFQKSAAKSAQGFGGKRQEKQQMRKQCK